MRKLSLLFLLLFVFVLYGCEHHHFYNTVTIEATCQESGVKKKICSCGDTIILEEIPIGDHEYGDWEVVVEPTETEKGLKQKKCLYCDETIEEEIDTLVHEHNYLEQVVEPTCLEQGYTTYACSCGEAYIDNYQDALGHTGGEATCSKKAVCTRCHEEYGFLLDHTWVDADCDNPKHCSKCDKKVGEALGHNYSEWLIIKDATNSETGLKERTCSICHDVESEIIPMIETINEYEVELDLNGGIFSTGYQTLNELAEDFISDYNNYGQTNATISNFHVDSTSTIKVALANSAMLFKWQWLFEYMYDDLVEYNTSINALKVSYVSDALDLLPLLIEGDTNVISDSSKGPNFRTLIRCYLHGVMNQSKGSNANTTFAAYVPDFSNKDKHYSLLSNQYDVNLTIKSNELLPIAVRTEYNFIGWMGEDGQMKEYPTANEKLTAVWEETVPVEKIEITNKVESLDLLKTLQLTWLITPSNPTNQNVSFVSSNPEVATIDENGLVTALKEGTVTIKIISQSFSGLFDEFELQVIRPGYFDISYETNSYVLVGNSIKLNALYYNSNNELVDLVWSTFTDDLVEVSQNGEVLALSVGTATVRVALKDNNDIYQDFIVTIINEEIQEDLEVILNAHESNVYVEYNLGIGAGTPVYYADIIGSVSKLLFNDDLEIDTTYNQATNAKYGDALQERIMENVEFITVHYTAGMSKGSTAEATAKYFTKPLSQVTTSIHYCTGNDGVFKGLDEQYKAAHAGDDGSTATVEKFEWLETGLEVLPGDPKFPVVSITKNATFAINGRDTGIKVPEKTQRGNEGFVTDSKWLNEQGLAVNIKDGKYQLGTAWWCYTQVWEGRICSNGGNRNSIGIETAVNEGSDLWYTWQKTAQLVGDLMYRYNLDITRVKGHHFFSAKNCPQPMLENELRVWWEFIDLCEAEYNKIVQLDNSKITFTSNSDLIDNKGRVTKQSMTSELVTYTVTYEVDGKTYALELASIIEGLYTK